MSIIEKRLQVGQVKPQPKATRVDGLAVVAGLLFVALTLALAGWAFGHAPTTDAMQSVDSIFLAP